ncbi:hypothetical protein EV363DRAFT_585715 [Boletus edulis]|nr:hypothetical protein EV363DRAFT_585715 [Boletus edulis]
MTGGGCLTFHSPTYDIIPGVFTILLPFTRGPLFGGPIVIGSGCIIEEAAYIAHGWFKGLFIRHALVTSTPRSISLVRPKLGKPPHHCNGPRDGTATAAPNHRLGPLNLLFKVHGKSATDEYPLIMQHVLAFTRSGRPGKLSEPDISETSGMIFTDSCQTTFISTHDMRHWPVAKFREHAINIIQVLYIYVWCFTSNVCLFASRRSPRSSQGL